MRCIGMRGADEAANLIEPLRREPAGSPSAMYGKAVGLVLVGADELVTAFVTVNPKFDGGWDLGDVRHVQDDELPIGRGGIVVEIGVEHRRK